MVGLLLGLLACSSSQPQTAELSPLQARRALIRASLDLRGVRPSADEFDRVAKKPQSYFELVAEFVQDPRFGDRVAEVWAPVFQTRMDYPFYGGADYGLDDEDHIPLAESMGEETLKILSRIAVEGLPFTTLVTADWTMADARLAQVWPLEFDNDGDEWQKSRYTDDRPHAGGKRSAIRANLPHIKLVSGR